MFEFRLPDVGEGVAEGEIVAWVVEEGDTVAEDQVVAEVETDKAVVDLPSPRAGTVHKRHAEEGDVVPVGDVVVTIDTGEESEREESDATAEAESGVDAAGESATDAAEPSAKGGRVFAPPTVRRLARERDVDIAAVAGSGPSGRVTEGDVRDAAGESDEDAVTPVTEADESATETRSAISKGDDANGDARTADRERTLATPATRRVAEEENIDIDAVPTEKRRDGEAFVESDDVSTYAETQRAAEQEDASTVEESTSTETSTVTTEPYRGVRRSIGERMEQSVYTAPHVSHHDIAVVDDLVEVRETLKSDAEERGVSLTYLPFVMKAVVAGLKECPILNSSLDEAEELIRVKHDYNVGVAVATEAGLMVPVVEDVDEKGLLRLASEVRDLAARARDRDLAREEMQGGTFTITNFGAIGGEYATPIINYPETAILGLGALTQRPTVRNGDVVAAHTLPLSLSIDHRVIDGADAANFTNAVIASLETPTRLLLE